MRIQSLEIPGIAKLLTKNGLAVSLFAQHMLELDEKSKLNSEVLYIAYVDWALDQIPKQPAMSKVAFGRLLQNATGLYPTSTRCKGGNLRIWHGVKLKEKGM